MSLGDRIKECRQGSKMSQEKVAELLEVSRQAVTKWEAGQTAPSTENLFKLAEIFGTTVDLLISSNKGVKQSSAEQIYYLYRMEEAKKVEELRIKRKKNVRIAIYIAVGYLGIFLVGWLVSGGLGQSDNLFDWLIRHYLFLIAAAISVVPALFGKNRFSIVTLAAFLLGLILGELQSKFIFGGENGIGHYGLVIWGTFFFMSIVIGMIWERLVRQKLSLTSRKMQLSAGIVLACAVILELVVLNVIPRYPQPEYSVNNYTELVEAFSGDPQYLFPSENLLPTKQGGVHHLS